MDNKKIFKKKKKTYPDNNKNLLTNHKSSLSKNNNNKSITNPSKKNHKNPITFTQFLVLIWKLYAPLKWFHPHSHIDNSYATDHSIHTPVSITKQVKLSSWAKLRALTTAMASTAATKCGIRTFYAKYAKTQTIPSVTN